MCEQYSHSMQVARRKTTTNEVTSYTMCQYLTPHAEQYVMIYLDRIL
jgi:hypothetical protein